MAACVFPILTDAANLLNRHRCAASDCPSLLSFGNFRYGLRVAAFHPISGRRRILADFGGRVMTFPHTCYD